MSQRFHFFGVGEGFTGLILSLICKRVFVKGTFRFVIPFFNSYEKSGEFTPKDKSRAALKEVIIWNIIMTVLGIFALFYLILRGKLSFSVEEIWLFVISSLNA